MTVHPMCDETAVTGRQRFRICRRRLSFTLLNNFVIIIELATSPPVLAGCFARARVYSIIKQTRTRASKAMSAPPSKEVVQPLIPITVICELLHPSTATCECLGCSWIPRRWKDLSAPSHPPEQGRLPVRCSGQ